MILSYKEVKRDLSRCQSVKFSDDKYVLPSFSYVINDFLPWFKKHLKKKGMVFTPNRFDCDDFAAEFCAKLKESALSLKDQAGIAVATVQVTNLGSSLGIGAGEHVLNLVGVKTKNGHHWLIIEPQNQKYVLLEDYVTGTNLRVVF